MVKVQQTSVERALNGGAYQQIATLPSNATTYSDSSAGFNEEYTYRLQAVNAFGQSGYSDIATAVLVNLAPVIAPIPTQVVNDGEELKLSVDATDPEDGKVGLQYSLLSAPDGMVIDSSGEISGWNGLYYAGDGDFTFTVKVTDGDGLSATTIVPVIVAPTASSIPHATTDAHAISQTLNTMTLGVVATDDLGGGDISYLWETVAHPGQSGLPACVLSEQSSKLIKGERKPMACAKLGCFAFQLASKFRNVAESGWCKLLSRFHTARPRGIRLPFHRATRPFYTCCI